MRYFSYTNADPKGVYTAKYSTVHCEPVTDSDIDVIINGLNNATGTVRNNRGEVFHVFSDSDNIEFGRSELFLSISYQIFHTFMKYDISDHKVIARKIGDRYLLEVSHVAVIPVHGYELGEIEPDENYENLTILVVNEKDPRYPFYVLAENCWSDSDALKRINPKQGKHSKEFCSRSILTFTGYPAKKSIQSIFPELKIR